jgi:8-oxo-dGTP pyrophosphatase MutT (NUDIX family)
MVPLLGAKFGAALASPGARLPRSLEGGTLEAMAVVRAAGGLLWRDGKKGRSGARLAVIHRPHRKDWSLPKGKLDDGETWEA